MVSKTRRENILQSHLISFNLTKQISFLGYGDLILLSKTKNNISEKDTLQICPYTQVLTESYDRQTVLYIHTRTVKVLTESYDRQTVQICLYTQVLTVSYDRHTVQICRYTKVLIECVHRTHRVDRSIHLGTYKVCRKTHRVDRSIPRCIDISTRCVC